jgi:aldehyde:ferredoxin oxidoreductase
MRKIKGGYTGKIARINLRKAKVKIERVKPEFALKYVGGRGFGARIIWDEVPKLADPLGPRNKLIVATGPLTGLLVPGAGKTSFSAISPATGYYGDANVGGMFGVELKQAGYDAVILEDSAKKPVYLWIQDGEIELRSASHLWGKGSLDAESEIKSDLGDRLIRVATIGPAGEKLVRFACVTCDYGRQAGRTGMGAVMGSKNVKAIAVRGTADIPVANLDELLNTFHEAMNYILNHKDLKIWQRQGTIQIVDWANEHSALPTRNFQEAIYENYRQIDGDAMEARTKIGNTSCFTCSMNCTPINRVNYGSLSNLTVLGPQYETAGMLGSNCALPTIEDVVYANYLCDNLGMDTISTGSVVAFAIECYEKGILTKEDLGGLELKFGNKEAAFKLMEMIAKREGLGDILAEGVKKASEKLGGGSESFAMHVKGLEISAYDHRAAQAMALAYATADIGGHHNRAWAITYDVKVGRETYSRDKAETVIFLQHIRPLYDCLGVCRFYWVELGLNPEYYAKFYKAATGVEKTLSELLLASERIYNLTRAISLRQGMKGVEDWLPERDFKDPIPSGPLKGYVLDKEKFAEMMQTYYQIRGWDKNGVPKKEKLKELGLSDVAAEIIQ